MNARDALIVGNLGLVPYMVYKYFSVDAARGYGDDLIGIGHIGLIKAADTYDASKGIAFTTYACKCIWSEVKSEFGRHYKYAVHVPAHIAEREARKGKEAFDEFVDRYKNTVSLNHHAWTDNTDDTPLMEIIASTDEPVEDVAIYNLSIERAMRRLTKRQRAIMEARLAELDAINEDIGATVGVTRERVRQVSMKFAKSYVREMASTRITHG